MAILESTVHVCGYLQKTSDLRDLDEARLCLWSIFTYVLHSVEQFLTNFDQCHSDPESSRNCKINYSRYAALDFTNRE
jgi:hypothetical protein